MILPKIENKTQEKIQKIVFIDYPREHLGVSILGHHCERWLWLTFRWAVLKQHDWRLMRIFARGHREEADMVQLLTKAGFSLRNHGENQQKLNLGCHVGGSPDGIISGVIEAPKTPHILEIKTHNVRSFNDLIKNGVEKSKPLHFIQMQLYMLGAKLTRALYVAVCKDDDRLHVERVRLDKTVAQATLQRGQRIAVDNRLPPPCSNDPTWYQCRLCDGHKFCHVTKTTKEVNCRTCAHSTAKPDSTWLCENFDIGLKYANQISGCIAHIFHPDMVPWKHLASPTDDYAVYVIDDVEVKNGHGIGAISSMDIIANLKSKNNGSL